VGIVKYMRGQVGPAAKPIQSVAALTKFLDNEDGGIVGYFDSDTDLKTAFTKAADKLRETFPFGIVSDPDVITAKGAERLVARTPLRSPWIA
jgi:protein disulfide isomerase family A protein 3